uniref:PHD-type domain-containing protein n=1 Tax=Helobdella robusta TaxID=6412 RepID=T1EGY8_HELRO
MKEIQRLIAPPKTLGSSKRCRTSRPNKFSKPDKLPNHDTCDSCKEPGDLICCDRCPCAFHLICYDPPLEEEDAPNGEWICRKSIAAKGLTPRQFQLPKEYCCPIIFPGLSTSSSIAANNANAYTRKNVIEMEKHMVPLPAKLCHICTRSCRIAPLLQCDYCPLVFHIDCLDPPLANIPSTTWMCPNHVEHVIDEVLLDSTRLSRRIELWEKYTAPLDVDAVKINFLKRIHQVQTPFRVQ